MVAHVETSSVPVHDKTFCIPDIDINLPQRSSKSSMRRDDFSSWWRPSGSLFNDTPQNVDSRHGQLAKGDWRAHKARALITATRHGEPEPLRATEESRLDAAALVLGYVEARAQGKDTPADSVSLAQKLLGVEKELAATRVELTEA